MKLSAKKIVIGVGLVIILLVIAVLASRPDTNQVGDDKVGFLRGVYLAPEPTLVFDDASVLFGTCLKDCQFEVGVKNLKLASSVRLESVSFTDDKVIKLSPKKLNQFILDSGPELQKTAFIVTLLNNEVIAIKEAQAK